MILFCLIAKFLIINLFALYSWFLDVFFWMASKIEKCRKNLELTLKTMNRTSDVYVKCIFNINVLIASFIVVLLWFHIMRNPMTMVTLFKTISGKCYIMIQQPIFIKYLVFQKQLKRSINFRCMRLPLRLYYVHYNQCLPWFICYILGVKWVQNICEVIFTFL